MFSRCLLRKRPDAYFTAHVLYSGTSVFQNHEFYIALFYYDLMPNIFSVQYCAGEQMRFTRTLEKGDYEEAERILGNIVTTNKPHERLERRIVLQEGYRALYRAYKSSLYTQHEDIRKLESTVNGYEIGGKYKEDSPNVQTGKTLDMVMDLLEEHGHPKEIDNEMVRLKNYEELGELEELREQLASAKKLEHLLDKV